MWEKQMSDMPSLFRAFAIRLFFFVFFFLPVTALATSGGRQDAFFA